MTKLVWGVGINNADYKVFIHEMINGKDTITWTCPYYRSWKNMFQRCYSDKFKDKRPWYSSCKVTPEWHYFMTFRVWMVEQDWEGKQLDKDLIVPGNKIYGPDTCVFLDQKVNTFLTERERLRGEWPIGVCLKKKTGRYGASCSDLLSGKIKFLGYYDTPEEAHQSWLTFKLEQAKILASQQSDPRIAAALIARYENYGEYK